MNYHRGGEKNLGLITQRDSVKPRAIVSHLILAGIESSIFYNYYWNDDAESLKAVIRHEMFPGMS